jgi:hypothetical protein
MFLREPSRTSSRLNADPNSLFQLESHSPKCRWEGLAQP